MTKPRTHLKADPGYAGPQEGGDARPELGAEPDPRQTATTRPKVGFPGQEPKAPEAASPEPVQIPNDNPVVPKPDADAVLNSPIKFVIDAPDAIEKMQSLVEKVAEARPDLAEDAARIGEAIEQLEQKTLPGGTGIEEEAPAQGTFAAGDRVMIQMEEGTYYGQVLSQNPDGTYRVSTDQAMSLDHVPEGAMTKQEDQSALQLPASLKAAKFLSKAECLADLIEYVGGEIFDNEEGFTFYAGTDLHLVNFEGDGKEFKLSFDALDGADQRLTYESTAEGVKAAGDNLIHELDPNYKVEGAKVKAEAIGQQFFIVERKWSDGNDAHFDGDLVVPAANFEEALNKAAEAVKEDFKSEPEEEDGDDMNCTFSWYHGTEAEDGEDTGFEESYSLFVQEKGFATAEEALSACSEVAHGHPSVLKEKEKEGDEPEHLETMAHRADAVLSWPKTVKASKKLIAKLKAKASVIQADATVSTSGVTNTGMRVVVDEQKNTGHIFDDKKDDTVPYEVYITPDGKLVLATGNGQGYDERKANGDVDFAFWKNIHGIIDGHAQAPKEGAPKPSAPEAGAPAPAEAPKTGYPENVAASPRLAAKLLAMGWSPNVVLTGKKDQAFDIMAAGKRVRSVTGLAEAQTIVAKMRKNIVAGKGSAWDILYQVKAEAPAPKPAAQAPVKPAVQPLAPVVAVAASAFDEIPEIEIGGGMTAHRKAEKKAEEGKEAAGAEIEVMDADGKVVATYPDAFGDDTVLIIKFLRQVLDIKETDDKKASKGKEKGEGKPKAEGPDASKKPEALPKTEEKKEEKAEDGSKSKKEELEANQKKMELRVANVRVLAEQLLRIGHIEAHQADIDSELIAGKTLAEAQVVAATKAVNRKVMELLGQHEEELLLLKASLPLLKARQVTVRASQGTLSPINLSAAGVIDAEKAAQFPLGLAFSSGFRTKS